MAKSLLLLLFLLYCPVCLLIVVALVLASIYAVVGAFVAVVCNDLLPF